MTGQLNVCLTRYSIIRLLCERGTIWPYTALLMRVLIDYAGSIPVARTIFMREYSTGHEAVLINRWLYAVVSSILTSRTNFMCH